jgi:hypothetical protein
MDKPDDAPYVMPSATQAGAMTIRQVPAGTKIEDLDHPGTFLVVDDETAVRRGQEVFVTPNGYVTITSSTAPLRDVG